MGNGKWEKGNNTNTNNRYNSELVTIASVPTAHITAPQSPPGELPILSAQQVTACTPNPLHCGGSGGCMGSIPQLAFTYIQLFGHVTEDSWP